MSNRFTGNWIEAPAGGNWLRNEWRRKRGERMATYGARFGLGTPEPEPGEPEPEAAASAARTTSGADPGAGSGEAPRRDAGDPFREFAKAARQFRASQGIE